MSGNTSNCSTARSVTLSHLDKVSTFQPDDDQGIEQVEAHA